MWEDVVVSLGLNSQPRQRQGWNKFQVVVLTILICLKWTSHTSVMLNSRLRSSSCVGEEREEGNSPCRQAAGIYPLKVQSIRFSCVHNVTGGRHTQKHTHIPGSCTVWFIIKRQLRVKRIVWHFRKYNFSLSFWEWDERMVVNLMSVCSVQSWGM